MLAAIALGDLAVFVLLDPLLHRRAWAWLVLLATIAGLVTVAHSPHLHLVLLLRAGGVRRAGGVDVRPHPARRARAADHAHGLRDRRRAARRELTPDLRRYTRTLTAAWAALLVGPGRLPTSCWR